MEKSPKFNKRRTFNKAVGPGKNPKLINVGPTFILDYRVIEVFSLVSQEVCQLIYNFFPFGFK